MSAAARGMANVVATLCKAGAEINATDKNGRTALMHASDVGYVGAVKELIKRGADLTITCKFFKKTALIFAAGNGHLDVIMALCRAGADINAESGTGRTPLMVAGYSGHIDSVAFLCRSGAEVNKACDGMTALILASNRGEWRAVEVLLQHGADAKAVDNNGETAMDHAIAMNNTQVISVLRMPKIAPEPFTKCWVFW